MIALATPLAMAFPVFGLAPAGASNGIQAPRDGSVITSGSEVSVRATYDFAFQMQLRAKVPGSGDSFLTSGGVFDHSLSAPLSINRNGRYTVYIKGSQTGHVYASSTFTVRIAPASPSGVSASASGGTVRVNWNLGYEDDLTGYSVRAGSGSKSGSVGSLCSGSSCSASVPVGSASGDVTVQVQALRSNGLGGSVSSSPASTSVAVGGGGNGNGPGTSVPPGTTPPPGGGGPKGNGPLTPFNNQSPVTLPSVQPTDATPGFTYPTPQVASNQAPKAENAAASTQLQWGRSIGIALILLVVAAHLGTWTRRLRTVQAGVSERGMAARLARGGSGRSRVRKAQQHIAQAEAMAKTAVLPAASDGMSPMGQGTAGPSGGDAQADATAFNAMPGADADASKPVNQSVVQGAAANPGPRRSPRRPARLGKRPGGVEVRIAGEQGRPGTAQVNDAAASLPGGLVPEIPGGPNTPVTGGSAPTAAGGANSGLSDAALLGSPSGRPFGGSTPEASGAPEANAPGGRGTDRPADLTADAAGPDSAGQGPSAPGAGTRPLAQRDIFSVESAVADLPETPDASPQDATDTETPSKSRRSGRGRRRRKN
ncbi:hypothetical protein [Actinomadura rupiterrae]|uniref:hypothetical protein n=1 Tax=Actinomadura rupiterrae TaxID=559627 RepID=UPI0020A5C51F|nr:hypothetical protein [Actinomadura rupiterrae]MCP2340358.1 hypothetical protein [Actinomadura rupiterrae]